MAPGLVRGRGGCVACGVVMGQKDGLGVKIDFIMSGTELSARVSLSGLCFVFIEKRCGMYQCF